MPLPISSLSSMEIACFLLSSSSWVLAPKFETHFVVNWNPSMSTIYFRMGEATSCFRRWHHATPVPRSVLFGTRNKVKYPQKPPKKKVLQQNSWEIETTFLKIFCEFSRERILLVLRIHPPPVYACFLNLRFFMTLKQRPFDILFTSCKRFY